jgi:transposase InsO family protein
MRRLGLAGICPKKWKTTTIIDHADTYPVDAVKRQWDTGALNQVWVGDITYLRTWEGWVYLATVIDAHSRRVIGWAIADHMRTDLIQDALTMAMVLRGDRPATVIFHSDYAEDDVKPRNRVDAGFCSERRFFFGLASPSISGVCRAFAVSPR